MGSLVSLFIYFKIGKGVNIRFWEDCRIGETSLAEAFPLLFRLSSFKDKNISDFIVRAEESSGNFLNWNFHFIWHWNKREFPYASEFTTY